MYMALCAYHTHTHCTQMLQYDLGDATKWEFFFPNVERPLLVVPGVGEEGQGGEAEVSSGGGNYVCVHD